jgi:hypothetical protein
MIKSGVVGLEKKMTEAKGLAYHIKSRVPSVNMNYVTDVHLSQVALFKFLHWDVLFPLFILYSLERYHCRQGTNKKSAVTSECQCIFLKFRRFLNKFIPYLTLINLFVYIIMD